MRLRQGLIVLLTLFLLIFPAFSVEAQDDSGDPQPGGQLYLENCAVCHGVDGTGRVGAGLDSFPGIEIGPALRQAISDGIEGSVMPGWSLENGGPLSENEIDEISDYIIGAFAGTEPIAPAPIYVAPEIEPLPDIDGDPSRGAVIYLENCLACHGEQGQGRFGSRLAKTWSGDHPEVLISQLVIEGLPGTTMPAWSEEFGGPLAEADIENVTAYVLSLAPVGETIATPEVVEGPLGRSASLILLGGLVLLVIVGLIIYYRKT
jgi:cytochrome c oxidase cbb3-type subunit III